MQVIRHQQNRGELVEPSPASREFREAGHTGAGRQPLEICAGVEACLHQIRRGDDGTDVLMLL